MQEEQETLEAEFWSAEGDDGIHNNNNIRSECLVEYPMPKQCGAWVVRCPGRVSDDSPVGRVPHGRYLSLSRENTIVVVVTDFSSVSYLYECRMAVGDCRCDGEPRMAPVLGPLPALLYGIYSSSKAQYSRVG